MDREALEPGLRAGRAAATVDRRFARRPANGNGSRATKPAAAPRPQVAVTAVSWSAPADLDLAEWVEQGRRIGVMGRSAGWWIGDWLRYGNAKYGEKYSRAVRITGYDSQTLMNMVYVASRFEISRRREKLSWSHHAELAPYDAAAQERLLDRSERDRLSVRDIRELIRVERRADRQADEEDEPETGLVVCPECGHRFAAE